MPDHFLAEKLSNINENLQLGQAIGFELMNKEEFQRLVLWSLADLYERLDKKRDEKESIIPTFSRKKTKSPDSR